MSGKDYAATHKAVFRSTFEALDALWPPEMTVEYWEKKASPACAVLADDFKDCTLGKKFAIALYEYLEEKAKELQGDTKK